MGNVNKWPALNVELISIEKVEPYAKNSRIHSQEQIDQIASSIVEWGWTTPVLIDENGVLIAGHGRVMAAKKLGIKEVPVTRAVGWSDAQKKAYVIADNKIALNSEWNTSLLAEEIEEIAKLDFDINSIAFSEKEISKLFDEVDGVTLEVEPKIEASIDEIKVKFSPDSRTEVINAVTEAIKNINSAEVWVE